VTVKLTPAYAAITSLRPDRVITRHAASGWQQQAKPRPMMISNGIRRFMGRKNTATLAGLKSVEFPRDLAGSASHAVV